MTIKQGPSDRVNYSPRRTARAMARAREEVQRLALLEAARDYVDATERGEGERLEGFTMAARLKIAAKAWVRAARDVAVK